jgi:hypothetical protein
VTRRWVRITLLLLAIIAIAAAGLIVSTTERQLQTARETARVFDDAAARLLARVVELRAAQQAYVAAGQGDAFWISRATAELARVRSEADAIGRLIREPGAAAALQAATETLEDFAALDGRIREYLQSGQRLMASDLIFADGLELLGGVAARITTARDVERAASDRTVAAVKRQELIALAASAGFVLFCLLLLTPTVRSATSAADPVLVERKLAVETRLAPPAPSSGTVRVTHASPLPLVQVASLCTDLGRVQDTRELPALLDRAARLLDARGLIVWIGGPGARELRPALSHGYAPAVVARMGGIATDADNATAAAYRTGELQIVKGEGTASGAVAAPLVSASGCIGVAAIEFPNGGESREPVQALAVIVAAQLATLVSVAPEPSQMRNSEFGIRN